MENITFTQDQLNKMYLFVLATSTKKKNKHLGSRNRIPIAEDVGNVTEQELFVLIRDNHEALSSIFRPITPVVEGGSIIYMDTEDDDVDDSDFEPLPEDPSTVVTSAMVLMFTVNHGINVIHAEAVRIEKLKVSAKAKLTAEEIKALGLE